MADQNGVNSTRRLVTAMGAALPLACASLAATPRTAEAAAAKDNASKGASPATKTSVKETLPPAGILMHPEYAQVIARMAYVWG